VVETFKFSFTMDDMDGESTKLRVSLTSKIHEILRDSSVPRVLKEGVVESLILHKARYE
jgi:hypothetical protein